ncbi:hypothetical protein T11_13599 [Trichinella zimbabwensis]|uniref:Uncharacterized protein n=1 Tax=Trichinella zimbabwensis TaxID=268475 RepID=A0A0V1ELP0_9BILA|nr:hypothetical protein T11_13599 [Trichinella zimbabwensis]
MLYFILTHKHSMTKGVPLGKCNVLLNSLFIFENSIVPQLRS